MSFNHEKLRVYQQTLAFNAKVSSWTGGWENKHAVCDHLPRAAGSMLENIAMASASYSAMKIRGLDYAIGSAFECAACIDIADIKQLIDNAVVYVEKEELSHILRMLVGLRRSWSNNIVREEQVTYGDGEDGPAKTDRVHDKVRDKDPKLRLFRHEELDVYIVALDAVRTYSSVTAVMRLPQDVFRRLDVLLTSMVLNIAEGNGRFCLADQKRFLGTSHEASIKVASRLDLCVVQGLIPAEDVQRCKSLLARVAAMTWAMIEAGEL